MSQKKEINLHDKTSSNDNGYLAGIASLKSSFDPLALMCRCCLYLKMTLSVCSSVIHFYREL